MRVRWILLVAGIAISAHAQAEVWLVGRGGDSWSTHADIAAGVDLTTPGILSPIVFSLEDNVTQAVQWKGSAPNDFVSDGNAHIWDNAALTGAAENRSSTLVDGDATTSTGERFKTFGVNQEGRIFFMDLGTSFPASSIIFYPRPTAQEDFIRSYEIAVSDGRSYSKDGAPLYEIVRQVQLSRDWRAQIDFPTQLLRFVRLRVLSANPFELAEIEIHGEGFVPKGTYQSSLIQLPTVVNFGTLSFRATKVRRQEDGTLVPAPDAEARVTLQLHNGQDDSPLRYYEIVDERTGREEETTGSAYAGLSDRFKGSIVQDLVNWSNWTDPIAADSSGLYSIQLDHLPGPRDYFQFNLQFASTTSDAMQVDSLAITYSTPVAAGAVGEVSLLAEPNPPFGRTSIPAGVDTTLTYDIRVDMGDPPFLGFDGVRIVTPARPEFLQLQIGSPLTNVEPDSVREEDRELRVYFPSNRVEQGRDERLRVTFRTRSLLFTTFLEGQLIDTRGRLPQNIAEGDANEEVSTNSLRVFFAGSGGNVINAFTMAPAVISPNGDGINDEGVFSTSIIRLVEATNVSLAIYDLSGRVVREVSNTPRRAGSFEDPWDGRDEAGNLVAPGIYVARLTVMAGQEGPSQTRVVHVVY